jgi:predicted transcriptional regulator
MFKAVANDKRLRMIRLLNEKGQLTLSEIALTMRIPQPTACRNLKILESVGIVKSNINHANAEYVLTGDEDNDGIHRLILEIINKT